MIKILIVVLSMIFVPAKLCGQLLPDYEMNKYTALFEWQKKYDGSWSKKSGHVVKRKSQAKGQIISFDISKKELYLFDDVGIYKVDLQPEWVAYIKRNHVAQLLSPDALNDEIIRIGNLLDSKYNGFNDDINKEKEKKEQEKKEKEREQIEEYKKDHPLWNILPISKFHNKCLICGEKRNLGRVLCMSGDTIFSTNTCSGYLGENYNHVHAHIKSSFDDKVLNEHIISYNDSLHNTAYSLAAAYKFNEKEIASYNLRVQKKAPNGFVHSFGFTLNYADGIEPRFKFFNSSNKTIKYVDLYFSIFNDVGDRCYLKYDKSYVGKIRGTGPVAFFEMGDWYWGKATHYTSGDASQMKIVKVIVTYMDNTTKALIGKNLIVESII